MTQQLPTVRRHHCAIGAAPRGARLASASSDLATDLPAQVVSCGVPFLFVPLTSRQAVDAVSIDPKALARCCRDSGVEELPTFFFTTDGTAGARTPRRRSTAACSRRRSASRRSRHRRRQRPARLLSARSTKSCTPEAARNILSLQGVMMKRPSRIHISIDSGDGVISRVRVGGRSVMVGHGELTINSL